MVVIVDNIWNQILRDDVLKEDHISKRHIYFDIDYKEFGFDQNRINTVRNLQDKCMTLKPDKGQGVV